ncbi:hypothetical protein ACFQ10_42765 [Streptomyces indonesiensis]
MGGIRPPIAVLSVLLLSLAGITALTLGKPDNALVPKAVLTSQQYVAEDGAIALRASLDESVTDLTGTATLFNEGKPVSADTVLDKVGEVYQKWRGTAVIEIKSGKMLAARGENVPLTAIDLSKLSRGDGLAPRMVRLENGQTRLIIPALLSWKGWPQQLLVASSTLSFPGVDLGPGRAIGVVDSTGRCSPATAPWTARGPGSSSPPSPRPPRARAGSTPSRPRSPARAATPASAATSPGAPPRTSAPSAATPRSPRPSPVSPPPPAASG